MSGLLQHIRSSSLGNITILIIDIGHGVIDTTLQHVLVTLQANARHSRAFSFSVDQINATIVACLAFLNMTTNTCMICDHLRANSHGTLMSAHPH